MLQESCVRSFCRQAFGQIGATAHSCGEDAARAERRSRQAGKLVDKWKLRVAELDRDGVAEKQARLWADEQT